MVSVMSTNRRSALDRIVCTIAAFQHATGTLPSPVSEVSAERILGIWLDTRRREHLNGTLNEFAFRELEQFVKDWQLTGDQLWSEWARDCADFMLRHDRTPNPVGASESERSLGAWYRSQLGTASLGMLHPDRALWLAEHCRFWAPVILQRPKAGA
jgi:hypothetical protein